LWRVHRSNVNEGVYGAKAIKRREKREDGNKMKGEATRGHTGDHL
jgi:hypothetical protein